MHEKVAKYLANEMEERERLEFESLLVEDNSLQEELFAQIEILEEHTKSSQRFNASKAYAQVEGQLKSTKVVNMPQKRGFSFLKVAATLLIVLTAGFFITKSISDTEEEAPLVFETSTAIDTFTLSDGTQIRLNANSRLEIANDFGVKNREVKLIGAANFDVARNEDLPFVINANNGSVEVLGTVFEVNAYPERDVELNVAEGKVKFASKTVEKEDLFEAGDTGLLTANGKELIKTKRKNENYAAWWTNRLVFEEASFEEVFKDLEKTYHVQIQFDESLSNCAWSAILEDYTLTEALEVLKTTYPNISKIEIKDSLIKLEGTACNN